MIMMIVRRRPLPVLVVRHPGLRVRLRRRLRHRGLARAGRVVVDVRLNAVPCDDAIHVGVVVIPRLGDSATRGPRRRRVAR